MGLRLWLVQQGLEVGLQIHPVVLGCLLVHPCGSILSGAPVGFLEPVDVHEVGQGTHRCSRHLPGQFCYPLLFR